MRNAFAWVDVCAEGGKCAEVDTGLRGAVAQDPSVSSLFHGYYRAKKGEYKIVG